VNAWRLVHLYVPVLGALLLLEGSALLIVDRLPVSLGFAASDTRHNVLHIVWGAALLAVVVMARGSNRVAWASLIFGVFYVCLAVLGVVVDRPFGLLLGLGENVFHFTVGPLALLLGAWALRSSSARRPLMSGSAAPGAGSSGSPAR
jgi:hypothetical protein